MRNLAAPRELAKSEEVDPGSEDVKLPRRRSKGETLRTRFVSNRGALVGLAILVVVLALVLAPSWFAPRDPNAMNVSDRLLTPSREYLLGTDDFGRDLLSRVIYGSRVSIGAASLAMAVAIAVGIPTGLIAGHYGGRIDGAFRAFFDGLMSIPAVLVVVAVTAALGVSLIISMITVGFVFSPRLFRIQRATTIITSGETYIEASKSIGCSTSRVLWRHVFPNTISPSLVQISLMFGAAVIVEASLSFIGLGVQPPQASWGTLISDGYRHLSQRPYIVIPAGVMITLTVTAFSLLGDGLRDALSWRTK